MDFVKLPNQPRNGALALADYRCADKYSEVLRDMGIELLLIPHSNNLYKAVSSHPDMLFHDLGEGYIVYEPSINNNIVERLTDLGFCLIKGGTSLAPKYPQSICYNAARVGSFVIHNFKYTDRVLLNEINKRGLRKINVRQGYSKCSICIVDENSIITADVGIHKAAVTNGLASLLIPPQINICLKGLDYGFIGGSTGKISKDRLCFFGKFEDLIGFEKIAEFLTERGVEPVSLGGGPLEDFGSLMIIKEKM